MATITAGLPPVKDQNIVLSHFPTKMQAVVFRMWEMVPAERIAKALETTLENVEKLAYDMGLAPQRDLEEWDVKGYITIIKYAWHILPYEQILTLLQCDEEKLQFILREDDFLGAKLGGFKPYCEKVVYRELTEEEKEKTAKIREAMEKYIRPHDNDKRTKPFAFFEQRYADTNIPRTKENVDLEITEEWGIDIKAKGADFFADLFIKHFAKAWGITLKKEKAEKNIVLETNALFADVSDEYHEIKITENQIKITAKEDVGILRGLVFLLDKAKEANTPGYKFAEYKRKPTLENRIIFSYCGLYAYAFDEPQEKSYPDELLEQYALLGVNGLWNQAILYKLVEFPFAKELSEGWEARQAMLKDFAARAKKYGIKIWLYLNEPRALPLKYFEGQDDILGHVDGESGCFCTSTEKVQKYLHDAVKSVCEAVPDMGGFISITACENWTHCYSRSFPDYVNCPRCSERSPEEVTAEVNHIISTAAKEVNPKITTLGWAAGWWSRHLNGEHADNCIRMTDKDIPMLVTSEEHMTIELQSATIELCEYSTSKTGPSERSAHFWDVAKEAGRETAAKIQVNNSWECCAVPFIPVFNSITTHIERLLKLDIKHIMLSWTVGGYPSDNLKIVSEYFFEGAPCNMFKVLYGDMAEKVKNAGKIFTDAFYNFPCGPGIMHAGPQNPGVSNLLYEKETGLRSTMTGFSYDNIFWWSSFGAFPPLVFENLLRKIYIGWEEGMKTLTDMPKSDFMDSAEMFYVTFRSVFNQVKFIRLRNEGGTEKEEIHRLLHDEIEMAEKGYEVMQRNACMGYEAANHYYYNRTSLMEKIINCLDLLEKF